METPESNSPTLAENQNPAATGSPFKAIFGICD
jgi:hypothetical protein